MPGWADFFRKAGVTHFTVFGGHPLSYIFLSCTWTFFCYWWLHFVLVLSCTCTCTIKTQTTIPPPPFNLGIGISQHLTDWLATWLIDSYWRMGVWTPSAYVLYKCYSLFTRQRHCQCQFLFGVPFTNRAAWVECVGRKFHVCGDLRILDPRMPRWSIAKFCMSSLHTITDFCEEGIFHPAWALYCFTTFTSERVVF